MKEFLHTTQQFLRGDFANIPRFDDDDDNDTDRYFYLFMGLI